MLKARARRTHCCFICPPTISCGCMFPTRRPLSLFPPIVLLLDMTMVLIHALLCFGTSGAAAMITQGVVADVSQPSAWCTI